MGWADVLELEGMPIGASELKIGIPSRSLKIGGENKYKIHRNQQNMSKRNPLWGSMGDEGWNGCGVWVLLGYVVDPGAKARNLEIKNIRHPAGQE